MAKVALDGTINIQGTKEIDRTNLAQLREPTTNDRDDCGRTEIGFLATAQQEAENEVALAERKQ